MELIADTLLELMDDPRSEDRNGAVLDEVLAARCAVL